MVKFLIENTKALSDLFALLAFKDDGDRAGATVFNAALNQDGDDMPHLL